MNILNKQCCFEISNKHQVQYFVKLEKTRKMKTSKQALSGEELFVSACKGYLFVALDLCGILFDDEGILGFKCGGGGEKSV